MTNADANRVLDSAAAPQLPSSWPLKRWAAIARDRVGDIGVVTNLQRSNAHGFFAMTTVYVRREFGWFEEFANGDLWPVQADAPRPHEGDPILSLTGLSGVAVGPAPTSVAFVAGVAATGVANVRATSPADEHDVHVDEGTGAFVALTIHTPEATVFRLSALDRNGKELDHVDYRDPWSRDD
jgi:hypothetical protein